LVWRLSISQRFSLTLTDQAGAAIRLCRRVCGAATSSK
jgi:hypothetical protein